MEQGQDPGSYHAHPYIQPPTDPAYIPPLTSKLPDTPQFFRHQHQDTAPGPFRLCEVSPEERATWCNQAAYELANLKNSAYHFGVAYDKIVTTDETQLFLTNVIEMNEKGKSTLACILEAMVGLERSAWTVNTEQDVQHQLQGLLNFDSHCRARLTALNM
jgi:hypothetical protein